MKNKFYGVYGGKTFGGKFPMVNKYFRSLVAARKFIAGYAKKHPRRKLKLARYYD